jgi:ATP-dependent Clp protease protease subunit
LHIRDEEDTMPELIVPMVIEKSGATERSFDIYSRLLRDRIIFLGTGIDDQVANLVTAQLLVLEHEDSEAPISLYINSPGGAMSGLFAIYDVMQYVRCDVQTICMGFAASAAAVLLAAGTPGKRFCLPNGRVLIHQPHGEIGHGQAVDIGIHAADFLKQRQQMNEILVRHTGQDHETIQRDTDRDKIFGAEEAKAYGLVDEIFEPRKLAKIGAFVPSIPDEKNGKNGH